VHGAGNAVFVAGALVGLDDDAAHPLSPYVRLCALIFGGGNICTRFMTYAGWEATYV
jgi:hypothetical protein